MHKSCSDLEAQWQLELRSSDFAGNMAFKHCEPGIIENLTQNLVDMKKANKKSFF